MHSDDLPATQILTFLSEATASPVPFTEAEIRSFSEVKAWLAKGYELDSFDNKLSTKNPSQVILLVLLSRIAPAA